MILDTPLLHFDITNIYTFSSLEAHEHSLILHMILSSSQWEECYTIHGECENRFWHYILCFDSMAQIAPSPIPLSWPGGTIPARFLILR